MSMSVCVCVRVRAPWRAASWRHQVQSASGTSTSCAEEPAGGHSHRLYPRSAMLGGFVTALRVRFAPSVSEALGGGGRHLCRGAGLTCSLEDSAAGMVLQMQRWPGAQRVERMLMGKSEGRRRKYIVSVLERSEDGAPNLEVPRSFLRRRSGSMHRLTEVTCAACGVYRSCDTLGAKAAFSALTSANRWRLHRMCLACVQVAACTSTRTRASRICQCSGATWCCRR